MFVLVSSGNVPDCTGRQGAWRQLLPLGGCIDSVVDSYLFALLVSFPLSFPLFPSLGFGNFPLKSPYPLSFGALGAWKFDMHSSTTLCDTYLREFTL